MDISHSSVMQVRLNKNYRSTRFIVEAASSVIQNNMKRCRLKNVDTDNSIGSKVFYLLMSKVQTFTRFSLLLSVTDTSTTVVLDTDYNQRMSQ